MKGLNVPVLFGTALAFAPLAWAQEEGVSSFLQQATEVNMAEMELAEVAEERAGSDEVKEYAEHLAQDHEKSNEKLESIAEQKDVELPDEPGAMHQQQKERLSKLEGQAFDRAYLDSMVREHQKTIQRFEQQAKTAQDPQVKQYAAETLPTLREHLKQAQQLQEQTQQQTQGQRQPQSR